MLDGTFEFISECLLLIRVLLKTVPGCCCIIDGFQNLGYPKDPRIKGSLDNLSAAFQEEEVGRLLLASSGPNPLLASVDKSALDRLDISKLVNVGRFVLSVELMSVPW